MKEPNVDDMKHI